LNYGHVDWWNFVVLQLCHVLKGSYEDPNQVYLNTVSVHIWVEFKSCE
jgi:hypothetical protein